MASDVQTELRTSFPAIAGVFEGVRVLSLVEQLPGPFATMLLAVLGADAILVERPKDGDPARAFPSLFESMACNKRSDDRLNPGSSPRHGSPACCSGLAYFHGRAGALDGQRVH